MRNKMSFVVCKSNKCVFVLASVKKKKNRYFPDKKAISGKDVLVYEEKATPHKPQKTCQTKRRRPVFAS
jgi:hypothetical protein